MPVRSAVKPVLGAALLALSATAHAEFTVYTSALSFLSAVQSYGVDKFDDLVSGESYAGPLSRSAGSYGYDVTTGDDLLYGAGNANGWLSNNLAADTITFSNFSEGVSAVGGMFFGSKISGAFQSGATIYVTATDADGSYTYTLEDARRFSFVGFVSNGPLLSLEVSADQAGGPVWGTVNNFVLAAVPEPETYAMLLAGLGALGFMARRRQG